MVAPPVRVRGMGVARPQPAFAPMNTDTATDSSTPPRVSVIIPVYNREAFVREAIESVLAQTFVDFELLVVDDGSTDATREVVGRIDDSRVRLITRAHA